MSINAHRLLTVHLISIDFNFDFFSSALEPNMSLIPSKRPHTEDATTLVSPVPDSTNSEFRINSRIQRPSVRPYRRKCIPRGISIKAMVSLISHAKPGMYGETTWRIIGSWPTTGGHMTKDSNELTLPHLPSHPMSLYTWCSR
jgi:hypothetical protein